MKKIIRNVKVKANNLSCCKTSRICTVFVGAKVRGYCKNITKLTLHTLQRSSFVQVMPKQSSVKRSYTKTKFLKAAYATPQQSCLVQLKKIVSGEISKKPFLDILLTDLEQSSFSLIRQNKIGKEKRGRLRIVPPTFLLFRSDSASLLPKTKLVLCKTSFCDPKLCFGTPLVLDNLRFWKDSKASLQETKLSFHTATATPKALRTSWRKASLYKNKVGPVLPKTKFIQNQRFWKEAQEEQPSVLGRSNAFATSTKTKLLYATSQVKTGDYVHCGDKIGKISGMPIVISESGKILKVNFSQITIQKMQPVLFYSQAEIHVESDEWVKRGTPILTLAHQTLVTGDIVQGIPRIEQLFEASTSTPPGTALQDFGSYSENDSSTKSLEKIYDYLKSQSQRNFLSTSFEKGIPNITQTGVAKRKNTDSTFTMHSTVEEKPLLLYKTLQSQVRELFRKKWNLLPLPVAVRQSLEEIQQIIVESIQKVYISQGVLIADKHIEIIVRQMTSKAQIFDGGSTGLLIDEILSLQQIENANISTQGQKALYLPVILGLTRAALSSDSFVSAASFQETTRVLSRDAIAGKSDFLRGLKEKVIIGDLIDAGTGLDIFYIYSLFSKKIFENKFSQTDNLKVTHKMLRKLVLRASK
ncbi:hypothetical protein EON73_00100 [bacterium]|nr:MAG: hypothetical protein EON73_00100 [bacterium]